MRRQVIFATALGLVAAALSVILGAYVVRQWPVWMVLRRTALHERVMVSAGEPITPRSIVVSLGVDGATCLDGVRCTPGQAAERFSRQGSTPVRTDPILFELHPGITFAELSPVFSKAVGRGWVNLSFLVETPQGPRALPLPLAVRFLLSPSFFLHGEKRELSKRPDRLWIMTEALRGGECLVKEIFQAEDPERMVTIRLDGGTLEGEPDGDRSWPGGHPPLGPWPPEMLRAFLSEPPVSALEPFVVLEVAGGDTAADVLRCLAALQAAAGDAVMVEIEAGS